MCDGCALGTTGLKDWTIDGVHLCNVRLRLLRLNTMAALDPMRLAGVSPLRDRHRSELCVLGRLPYPMLRKRGDMGFRRIMWDEALATIADTLRATRPERMYFYLKPRHSERDLLCLPEGCACHRHK